MKRILTAIIAPGILFFSFLAFDTITGSTYIHLTGSPLSIRFLIVYFFSFPFFLLIGIPSSIIIDMFNKGVRWVKYAIAGVIVALIMQIIGIIGGEPIFYNLDYFIICPYASIIFYLLLKSLEIIFSKVFGEAHI